jgi:hypothetical protein
VLCVARLLLSIMYPEGMLHLVRKRNWYGCTEYRETHTVRFLVMRQIAVHSREEDRKIN